MRCPTFDPLHTRGAEKCYRVAGQLTVLEPQTRRPKIGELLLAQGLLSRGQLRSALAHQDRFGGRLGRALLLMRYVGEDEFLGVLGHQLGVPVIHIGDRHISQKALAYLPAQMMLARKVLPLDLVHDRRVPRLVVAFAWPEDLHLRDEVAFASGLEVVPVLVGETDLDLAIARHVRAGPGGRSRHREPIELSDEPLGPMLLVDGRVIPH
ncbi:MAG TPA: hypothetical protein VLV17_04315 [Anaeromyxobacteraceae bacterium]|nr:hypothetical protein [Anaeromyxobacteraceae bacterium]